MATDISNLIPKTENDGTTDAGRLTAKEWNSLVTAVEENQRAVKGVIKGINYNDILYSNIVDGILQMNVMDTSGRKTKFEFLQSPSYPNNTITKGSSCIVEFNVYDQVQSEEDASVLVPYENPGKVTFYVDDKQVGTVNQVYSPGFAAYKEPVKFDFAKATTLSTKSDGNTLKIEYVNSGVTIEKTFTVYVLDLSLSVNIDNVYTTDNTPNIKVTMRGVDYCNLFVELDGNSLVLDDNGNPASIGTLQNSVPFYIDDELSSYNTHGLHTIKIWAEPTEYEGVSTDVLIYNYIFGDVNSSVPVVMTTIVDGSEYELYSKLVVDYIAYLSGSQDTNKIAIKIVDASNKVLLETLQSIEFNNGVGTGSYTFTLFPNGDEVLVGDDRKLIISIFDSEGNEYIHEISIVITNSSVALAQAPGYLVYLSSMGRSNQEDSITVKTWLSTSTDGTNTVVDVTFNDDIEFIDTGSGWIEDSNGNVAMHLRKGKYFTLNHRPFNSNPTYNSGSNNGTGDGLTISVEFATRNCLNADAKVISCMDYTQEETGRGFYVTASNVKLLANDIELGAKFKEDTRIKLDIVIEGDLNKYYYDTVVGTDPSASDYIQKGSSDECLALIFIDGVYTGLTLVKSSTTFQQGSSSVTPPYITFGSDDCDLDIYNIRVYNRALTVNEIVQNYSYDTPNQEDKIAIAKRNDIFSSVNNNMPTIDVGKLRVARPDLPFFYVTLDPEYTDIMPQNKSDWKPLTVSSFQNPNAASGASDEAKTSWEANTGVLRNQGTSSMTYPWPWRNWDWKTGDSDFGSKDAFKYYFPDLINTVETASKWHQYDYSGSGKNLALKKLTFKKDYASSEMCNNAICSEIFTDMAIGIATAYPNAVSPAMRTEIEESKKTDFRLSFKALPCFMFQNLPNPEEEGSAGRGLAGMGMMNLIPNKNEVGYLGFKSNKWENAENNETAREQSWELCDNLDDVFWVKELDYFQRNSDGTFTNSIKDVYEARTPKDSSVSWSSNLEADFGMTPKGLKEISSTEAASVYDEQLDIVDFHNWLVSTNQYLATDNVLKTSRETWNNDGSGNALYTTDSKEYRKAKFKNEAADRLLLDQWILYYIWREQFWMFDSGFKNLQVYTVGPNPNNPSSSVMQWGCMVRDADTALGIENTGRDYFPPHIEDIDYYTESNGKIEFHYNGAKNIYDITELKAKYGDDACAVLNGQFGSIWVNLRDCFSAEIGQMYRTLTANSANTHFGADPCIKKFRAHQENWCESLYNFGMRQYFGGSPFSYFNTSGLGDKKNSRASWLDRGFYYRRGKYRNLSDSSAFRINTYESPDSFDSTLNVKAYIPMYIGCGGTTAEMINSKNVIRLIPDTYEDGSIGKPISVGEDGFNFPNTGDAVSYIYGTSMLTDIGDLARVCKLLRVQNMNFPKLREFNLGHESARDGITYYEYTTTYVENENGDLVSDGTAGEKREFTNEILPKLDCSSMTQLRLLDVTNHTNLSELIINNCDQLQKLYARGTIMKSIALPATTTLETVYLGDKLTSLNLKNLTGIKEFEIEGLNDCAQLVIENCGDYMGKKSYDLVTMAINKLESVYDPVTNPSVCTLRGIDWTDVNADQYMLERLVNIDATITGKIKIKGLSNDLKVKLKNNPKYGDIDNPNNHLYIEYTRTYITDITIPSKMYIYEEGDHQLTFSVLPAGANTYDYAEWTLSANKYADINKLTGVITRNSTECDENNSTYATLTLKVYQIAETDGTERDPIVKTSSVYFYERLAKPGDIVFNDGMYSDELDSTKTPIGVCFYVDPNNIENRLMTALAPISANNYSTFSWGASYGGNIVDNSGNISSYYGAPYLYIDDAKYSFDLLEITNVSASGFSSSYGDGTTDYFSDENYRDSANSENNYFKQFTKFGTSFGDLGWFESENTLKIDKLGDTGTESISINAGDNVPIGYYKTFAIIHNRNKLLDAYEGVDGQSGAFVRPAKTANYDELTRLGILMNSADKWSYEGRSYSIGGDTKGSLLYYPAASACFAYEPNATNLNNKFKKYNWFLPAAGELARILYYVYQSYNGGALSSPLNSNYDSTYNIDAAANAFYNAFNLGVLDIKNLNYYYWSSTENSAGQAFCQKPQLGTYNNNSKYSSSSYKVLPICKF